MKRLQQIPRGMKYVHTSREVKIFAKFLWLAVNNGVFFTTIPNRLLLL